MKGVLSLDNKLYTDIKATIRFRKRKSLNELPQNEQKYYAVPDEFL